MVWGTTITHFGMLDYNQWKVQYSKCAYTAGVKMGRSIKHAPSQNYACWWYILKSDIDTHKKFLFHPSSPSVREVPEWVINAVWFDTYGAPHRKVSLSPWRFVHGGFLSILRQRIIYTHICRPFHSLFLSLFLYAHLSMQTCLQCFQKV